MSSMVSSLKATGVSLFGSEFRGRHFSALGGTEGPRTTVLRFWLRISRGPKHERAIFVMPFGLDVTLRPHTTKNRRHFQDNFENKDTDGGWGISWEVSTYSIESDLRPNIWTPDLWLGNVWYWLWEGVWRLQHCICVHHVWPTKLAQVWISSTTNSSVCQRLRNVWGFFPRAMTVERCWNCFSVLHFHAAWFHTRLFQQLHRRD